MIIPDKKKAVTVILSKMGESSHSEQMPEEEMDHDKQALLSIAQDIIAAFDKKSAHDLMVGLQSFWECLESNEVEE